MTALPAHLMASSAHLTCRVDSNPASKVVWYHNNLLLSQVATLASNSSYQTLILDHLSRDTIGEWQCVASNSLGKESDTVEVVGSPESVSLNTVTNTTSHSLTINWTVVSLVGITNTTIQYRQWGADWTTITRFHPTDTEHSVEMTYSHELTNLSPGSQYEMRVFCSNQLGVSEVSRSVYARTRERWEVDLERYTADKSAGITNSSQL